MYLWFYKLRELLGERYSLGNVDKPSYVLGCEFLEDKFKSFFILVGEKIVGGFQS